MRWRAIVAVALVCAGGSACQARQALPEQVGRSVRPTRVLLGEVRINEQNELLLRSAVSVCFLDARHGFLRLHGHVRETADGGAHWMDAEPTSITACLEARRLGRPHPIRLPPDCEAVSVSFWDDDHGAAVCGGEPGAGQQLKWTWLTVDGGRTWRRAHQTRAARLHGDVTSSGYVDSLQFVAPHVGLLSLSRGSLQLTTDGGLTWHMASPYFDSPPFVSFVDARTGYLFPVRGDGLYRTDDGGRRWRRVYPQPTPQGTVAAVPASGQAVLLGSGAPGPAFPGDGTIYRSTNAGRTWRVVGDIPNANVYSIGAASTSEVYAVGRPSGVQGSAVEGSLRLYRSRDGGVTWAEGATVDLPEATVAFVSPRVGFLLGGGELKRSQDGGDTWRPIAHGVETARFLGPRQGFAVLGDSSAEPLFARTEDGGRTWTPLHVAIRGLQLGDASMTSFGGDHLWLFATACVPQQHPKCQGIVLRTANAGRAWDLVRIRDGVPPRFAYGGLRAGPMFVSATDGLAFDAYGVYRSRDAGRTWSLASALP